ncbi:hypothetical protein [Streptomyces tateyamensis]|nr:hypothetical protein [Streptomyces tateyamensis]
MPDRAAASRGRRPSHSAQTAQGQDGTRQSVTPYAGSPYPSPHQSSVRTGEWPAERSSSPHPLGIPRILGRRARWVSARLRRDA